MKEHEKPQTKAAILNAAKKEFADKGLAGARVSAIAKRAKANPALIHYYFENKEKLYLAVLRHFFVREPKREIFFSAGPWELTPSQRLYVALYMLVHLRLAAMDPDLERIFFWEFIEGRKHFAMIVREYFIPRQEILLRIIEEGVRLGDFETRNPLFVVMNLASFLTTYAVNRESYRETLWHDRLFGADSKKDLLDFVMDHTFRALAPAGRPFALPELPGEIRNLLDEMIETFRKEKVSVLTDDILAGLRRVFGGKN
jgi:TetR/AcrR family transcriptional regulator